MSGPLRATSLRVIRTGNCSRPKRDNERMPATRLRSLFRFGFGFCLIAAASAPSMAGGGAQSANAQIESLSFAALDGWKDDDHAAAFGTFLKSCGAILNAGKGVGRRAPFLARSSRSVNARWRPARSTVSRRAHSSRTISNRCESCRLDSPRAFSPAITKPK